MRLVRYKENPILEKNPENTWEAGSVLNPSVIFDDGIFRMVYRATNDVKKKELGGYVSSIGYAESKDGINFSRAKEPLIKPDQSYEDGLGCEDPRVTKIADTYYLYYTAVKGIGKNKKVRIAIATSQDFVKWKKHGLVGPNTNSKAAVLFPEKIKGQYIMLYTWMADTPMSSIIHARFDSLDDVIKPPKNLIPSTLDRYEDFVVISPEINSYRGPEVGAVPIKTKYGWLLIYCRANSSGKKEWAIGVALLDLFRPNKVVGVLDKPILRPEKDMELKGIVNNVTFPEGAVIVEDKLHVYYGSGDQGICLATCNVKKLLHQLKKS